MRHTALNKRWQDHTYNIELYRNITNITITIREHRMHFSGHCWRTREEMIIEVLLWEPLHGQRKPLRPQKTYAAQCAQLRNASGCTTDELKTAIGD